MVIDLSKIFPIYLALAFFSVTLNNYLGLPDSTSVTYALLPVFYYVGLLGLIKKGIPIRLAFVSFFILSLLLIATFLHSGVAKLILYYVLSFSLIYIYNDSMASRFVHLVRWVSIIFSIVGIILSIKYYFSGGDVIGLYDQLLFVKQEYTVAFCVYVGVFIYLLQLKEVLKIDLVIIFFVMLCSFLIGNKSVFFVAFISCVIVFREHVRFRYVLVILFLLFLLFSFGIYPGILKSIYQYYFGGGILSLDEYREMETILVRQTIYVDNLRSLFSNFHTLVFGSGVNVVSGETYVSDYTWYHQDMGDVYESGLLYMIMNAGLVVGGGIFIYFLILLNLRDLFSCVLLVLLVSNLFQDNISSIFWLVVGGVMAERYKNEI